MATSKDAKASIDATKRAALEAGARLGVEGAKAYQQAAADARAAQAAALGSLGAVGRRAGFSAGDPEFSSAITQPTAQRLGGMASSAASFAGANALQRGAIGDYLDATKSSLDAAGAWAAKQGRGDGGGGVFGTGLTSSQLQAGLFDAAAQTQAQGVSALLGQIAGRQSGMRAATAKANDLALAAVNDPQAQAAYWAAHGRTKQYLTESRRFNNAADAANRRGEHPVIGGGGGFVHNALQAIGFATNPLAYMAIKRSNDAERAKSKFQHVTPDEWFLNAADVKKYQDPAYQAKWLAAHPTDSYKQSSAKVNAVRRLAADARQQVLGLYGRRDTLASTPLRHIAMQLATNQGLDPRVSTVLTPQYEVTYKTALLKESVGKPKPTVGNKNAALRSAAELGVDPKAAAQYVTQNYYKTAGFEKKGDKNPIVRPVNLYNDAYDTARKYASQGPAGYEAWATWLKNFNPMSDVVAEQHKKYVRGLFKRDYVDKTLGQLYPKTIDFIVASFRPMFFSQPAQQNLAIDQQWAQQYGTR